MDEIERGFGLAIVRAAASDDPNWERNAEQLAFVLEVLTARAHSQPEWKGRLNRTHEILRSDPPSEVMAAEVDAWARELQALHPASLELWRFRLQQIRSLAMRADNPTLRDVLDVLKSRRAGAPSVRRSNHAEKVRWLTEGSVSESPREGSGADDVGGGEAAETVTFTLDGKSYEIQLKRAIGEAETGEELPNSPFMLYTDGVVENVSLPSHWEQLGRALRRDGDWSQREEADVADPIGRHLSILWDDPAAPLDEDSSETPSTLDAEDIAPAIATLNHALAGLFLRLGPPPDPTEQDFAPVGSGDGGAQA